MPLHVKAKSKWKSVTIDNESFQKGNLKDLLCCEELSSYEIISDNPVVKKKSNDTTIRSNSMKATSPSEESKLKKKKKRKKKKPKPAESPNTSDEKTDDVNEKVIIKENNKKKTVQKIKEIKQDQSKSVKQTKSNKKQKSGGKIVQHGVIEDIAKSDAPEEEQDNDKTKQFSKKKKKRGKRGKRKNNQAVKDEPVSKKQKVNDVSKETEESKDEEKETKADMSEWMNLYVPEPVLKSLGEEGFTTPTPIQTQILPSAIRDRMDVIGAAATGSGKTLAFGIPLIHNILAYKEKIKQQLESRTNGTDISDSSDNEESDIEDSDNHSESDQDIVQNEENSETNNDSDEDENDEETENSSDNGEEDQDMDYENAKPIELSSFGLDVTDLDTGIGSDESDEEFDRPPSDDDDFSDEEATTGCVRAVNNVKFPWLDEEPTAPTKAVKRYQNGPLLGLILTPTRELAIQVKNHLETAAKYTDIKVAVIVGGMASQKQERILKRCPEIVVATPGRLWELIEQGEPHLATIKQLPNLIIDEADRMVEKGHFEEMEKILELANENEDVRKSRQTFVFSATLTLIHSGPLRVMKKQKKAIKMDKASKLEELVRRLGVKDKHKVVDLSPSVGTVDTLTEAKIPCTTEDKDVYLYYILAHYPGRTLVFANSKDCVRRLTSILTLLKCNPLPLHADMQQRQRLKNLDRFTSNAKGLLLATDVAARGLDIPNVEHVIHYQVPRTSENYVHRSGRTARANKEGLSVMLIGPEDNRYYRKIINTLNKDEDLPMFPIEIAYMNTMKARVQLARRIDKQEHGAKKKHVQNDWFLKAAEEMEIDVDDNLLHDMGSSSEQAHSKQELTYMRLELSNMLKQPLSQRNFSGKYPTKSGKLVVPYLEVASTKTAVTTVQEAKKTKQDSVTLPSKRKKKNKFKNKQK
ncbi:unnamed protein product [Owenia fusiformis]|uniref:ATP-dependent RNA helicase n=1 Tax=Owenia fusiformis TaxID=6347 RepID=A0A8J1XYZ8_OWEFU|nr:unnamed protein product [Owenia fusiformis]